MKKASSNYSSLFVLPIYCVCADRRRQRSHTTVHSEHTQWTAAVGYVDAAADLPIASIRRYRDSLLEGQLDLSAICLKPFKRLFWILFGFKQQPNKKQNYSLSLVNLFAVHFPAPSSDHPRTVF